MKIAHDREVFVIASTPAAGENELSNTVGLLGFRGNQALVLDTVQKGSICRVSPAILDYQRAGRVLGQQRNVSTAHAAVCTDSKTNPPH